MNNQNNQLPKLICTGILIVILFFFLYLLKVSFNYMDYSIVTFSIFCIVLIVTYSLFVAIIILLVSLTEVDYEDCYY
jgi:ABC-type multidrug transport system permease subunit